MCDLTYINTIQFNQTYHYQNYATLMYDQNYDYYDMTKATDTVQPKLRPNIRPKLRLLFVQNVGYFDQNYDCCSTKLRLLFDQNYGYCSTKTTAAVRPKLRLHLDQNYGCYSTKTTATVRPKQLLLFDQNYDCCLTKLRLLFDQNCG